MIPPAAAVVMGIVMVVLAVRSDDGLVVDDYYKRGLAINQVLDREARAAALGLVATLSFSPDRDRVRVLLSIEGQRAAPATLPPGPGRIRPWRSRPARAVCSKAHLHGCRREPGGSSSRIRPARGA